MPEPPRVYRILVLHVWELPFISIFLEWDLALFPKDVFPTAGLTWGVGTLLGFFTKLFHVAKSWGLGRRELLASSGWGQPKGGSPEVGTLVRLVSSASPASPGVMLRPWNATAFILGSPREKSRNKGSSFPCCGSLFPGYLGPVSSIADWNEESEFKSSSQLCRGF